MSNRKAWGTTETAAQFVARMDTWLADLAKRAADADRFAPASMDPGYFYGIAQQAYRDRIPEITARRALAA